MTRHALRIATMLLFIGALTAACSSMTMPSISSGTMSTPESADVSLKMPAGSEFSNGPTTPGGMAKGSLPSSSEFSNGPSSGGGAKKSAVPAGSEFSNGPK